MSNPQTSDPTPSATSLPVSASGPTPSDKLGGPTTGPSGLVPRRANLSARQAKEKGLLTSGTYGLPGSGSSTSADLQSSLESRLRRNLEGLGSTLYRRTWKEWVTPSGRALFRLVVSARRTSGNGCSSWQSPKTGDTSATIHFPKRKGGGQPNLAHEAEMASWLTPKLPSGGACERNTPGGGLRKLEDQADLASWPTPNAGPQNDTDTKWEERRKECKERHGNNGFGLTLGMASQLTGLATPNARDRKDGAAPSVVNSNRTDKLTHAAAQAQLTASGETPSGSHAETEKPGQLNPALSRWLMGLPKEWDACGVTAMRSLRRSRKSGSKRTAMNKPKTRLIRTHEPWNPWAYQTRAVKHLMERGAAALFLDPGLGKTAITLEAFRQLKEAGQAEKMLVVAPLRVCQLVWRQEGRKWTQFRDLTFSLVHGPKKEEALAEDVDIHLINPEGIAWLVQQFYGRTDLPWDTVVLDELTKFKNHRAQRSKKLRKKLVRVKRRWGLTGSPAPNGYMDLFGQMLILDDGASLGRYITYFRDQYFIKNWDGFSYDIRPGSAERIEKRIAPYVLRMSAEDYLDLPPLVDNRVTVTLPPKAQKAYEEMKQEMILTLPEGVVTSANAAATYSKLKQLTNGAVYLSDEGYTTEKRWVEIHTAKLDALEDLIDELAGQPLLVAYEFQHDLARLRERLGDDVPTLSGISGTKIEEVEGQWNRGELPVLLVHPASAGHGLNLQGAKASHICWFSKPWDLEMYDQTIRRILRQGSTSDRIINHSIIIPDSIDEIVEAALGDKTTTQTRLLNALNAEIMRDDPAPSPDRAQPKEETMALKKLGFKGGASPAPAAQEPAPESEAPKAPKGWGAPPTQAAQEPAPEPEEQQAKPKGWGPPPDPAETQQRDAVQSKLKAPEPEEPEEVPPSVKALNAFPDDVVSKLAGGESEDDESPLPPAASAPEADPWEPISTRYSKLLKEYFHTPEEAYAAGKDVLLSEVDGFGKKGWEELEDLCGQEPGPEEEKEVEPEPKEVPAAQAQVPPVVAQTEQASSDTAQARVETPDLEVLDGAKFTGANPRTLASLFETIAKLLRGE